MVYPSINTCRMRQICLAAGCLLIGVASAVANQASSRSEAIPLSRQRHSDGHLTGLQPQQQNLEDIDVDSLEELWLNEAVKAQDEAERLLGGNNWHMSMVPTIAPVMQTIPPFLPTPIMAPPTSTPPTVGTTAPTSANGCHGLSRQDFLSSVLSSITPTATLQDPTTPQGQAFSFLNVNDPLAENICTYPSLEERYALVTFYFSTKGSQWLNSTGWLSGSTECNWYGITCNDGVFTSNITLRK
jgi:hypothetical protein